MPNPTDVSANSDEPASPQPGSPEFLAMIERHKDYIEQETGIRPRFILDIGAGDIPSDGAPKRARKKRR